MVQTTFKRTILKIGDSLAITIPSKLVNELTLFEGDIINVEINREKELTPVKCSVCNYEFVQEVDEREIFCPCCGYGDKDE